MLHEAESERVVGLEEGADQVVCGVPFDESWVSHAVTVRLFRHRTVTSFAPPAGLHAYRSHFTPIAPVVAFTGPSTTRLAMTRYPALAPLHPSIPAADGLILRGTLVYPHGRVGTKYPLAVLAHQFPATRDSFAPLCADLHALGIATLAFDMRGQGESIWTTAGARVAQSPAEPGMSAFGAAFMGSAGSVGFPHIADDIVRMTAWGTAQNFIDPASVVLVGGSVGGTGVLLATPRLADSLRGVVTLGAAGAGVHSPDAMDRIRRNCETVRVPMYLASSEQDPFDGASNIRVWSPGLSHVTTRIVPGSDHAMAIYYVVRTELLTFVRKSVAHSGRARKRPATTKKGRRSGRRAR